MEAKVQRYVKGLISQNEKCREYLKSLMMAPPAKLEDSVLSFLKRLEVSVYDEDEGESTENENEEKEQESEEDS